MCEGYTEMLAGTLQKLPQASEHTGSAWKELPPPTFVERRTWFFCTHATPVFPCYTLGSGINSGHWGTNHSHFHGYKTDLQFWGNKYRLREGFPGRWCHCLRTKSATLRLFYEADVRNRKIYGAFVLKFLSTSETYCVLNSLFIPDLLDL